MTTESGWFIGCQIRINQYWSIASSMKGAVRRLIVITDNSFTGINMLKCTFLSINRLHPLMQNSSLEGCEP
jgi:hypothetical protein